MAQVLLVSDHVAPVLHSHHRVERIGIVANGKKTADDAAHRGACDDIDGDARPLQHLQHTNVCHALCSTATEYDGHFFPINSVTIVLGIRQDAHQQDGAHQ